MSFSNDLFLHEEVLLLALKDKEGTIVSSSMYHYALGGAIAAELLMGKRIAVGDDKKKKVMLIDEKSFNDPILDECMEKLKTAKKPAVLQTWVSKFASIKKLKHRIAEQLCRKGILREDEGKVMLLFKRKIYPEVNPIPEKKLIDRIHKAIFTDTDEIDSRTIVIVALAKSSNLLNANFDKKELKTRKKRIEQIISGDVVGKATKEAIEAVQVAIMVATTVPVITSS
ncbi:GPP34 family phosphoprotein [candidate division KSB1 bacterium]